MTSVGENQDRRYTETDGKKEMDIILIISSSRLQNLEQKNSCACMLSPSIIQIRLLPNMATDKWSKIFKPS